MHTLGPGEEQALPVAAGPSLTGGVPQTYNNVLHVYGLHWAKEHALPLGGALEGSAAALRRCDLYLQHSVALEQARSLPLSLHCHTLHTQIPIEDPGCYPAPDVAVGG